MHVENSLKSSFHNCEIPVINLELAKLAGRLFPHLQFKSLNKINGKIRLETSNCQWYFQISVHHKLTLTMLQDG
jgi:hypothetical protein